MVPKKTVWIINQYGSLPFSGIGGRHRHISRELSRMGYNVSLVSAQWSHLDINDYAASAPGIDEFEGFRFLRIRVGEYKNAHDKKRIFNWFSFAWRIRNLHIDLAGKPDVIIYSSPSLIAYLSAYRLSKKFNAKLFFEVRDIWPLTLVDIGGYSPRHPFIRFMQWLEDFAYAKSDAVISNLEGAVQHMASRGLPEDKFCWVPNGYSEIELNDMEPAPRRVLDSIKSQPFSVTYAGALGSANSLDTLIDAAGLLKSASGIHFNIVGRGHLVEDLKRQVQNMNLDNVHFWGGVPKTQVQSILQVSDVCVICWRNSSLYKYGVAANKLFDYLYSGKPIINAYSGGYDIVERYGAGITIDAENPEDLAAAVLSMSRSSPDTRKDMGLKGKAMVCENHEYRKIAQRLANLINQSFSA